jgi:hypothetical protein
MKLWIRAPRKRPLKCTLGLEPRENWILRRIFMALDFSPSARIFTLDSDFPFVSDFHGFDFFTLSSDFIRCLEFILNWLRFYPLVGKILPSGKLNPILLMRYKSLLPAERVIDLMLKLRVKSIEFDWINALAGVTSNDNGAISSIIRNFKILFQWCSRMLRMWSDLLILWALKCDFDVYMIAYFGFGKSQGI